MSKIENALRTLRAHLTKYEEHTGDEYPEAILKGHLHVMLDGDTKKHVGRELGDKYTAQEAMDAVLMHARQNRTASKNAMDFGSVKDHANQCCVFWTPVSGPGYVDEGLTYHLQCCDNHWGTNLVEQHHYSSASAMGTSNNEAVQAPANAQVDAFGKGK